MKRYLIQISYMGTYFKSFTKNVVNGIPVEPSVMGVMEGALAVLKPSNQLELVSISRTDTGVHALNNAIVVDLERNKGKYFTPSFVHQNLSRALEKTNHDLKVDRVQIVPPDFNSHGKVVLSRSYIYRLAIVRNSAFRPRLEQLNRCYFLYVKDFDADRMKEAASMFVGHHDFRSFMNDNHMSRAKASFAARTINSVTVSPSHAHVLHPQNRTPSSDIDYWDITFVGRSYVHRQIRRMVGACIAYARNKISHRDLYEMLTIPSKNHFSELAVSAAPSYGLYLENIEFAEAAMTMLSSNSEQTDDKQKAVAAT